MIEEDTIIEDEVIETVDGQQYIQTVNGLVKLEREDYDNIIYRLVFS